MGIVHDEVMMSQTLRCSCERRKHALLRQRMWQWVHLPFDMFLQERWFLQRLHCQILQVDCTAVGMADATPQLDVEMRVDVLFIWMNAKSMWHRTRVYAYAIQSLKYCNTSFWYWFLHRLQGCCR
jgi:hypothetical protein